MKVLILTNPTYEEFVWNTVRPYHKLDDDNLILVHGLGEKIDDWDEINGIGYDIGISFMYQHKVPAKEVNTHTWINFHPAPLPEYKGRNLCYHAIMNGETEFGATLHYMDENFDTGNIISVVKFDIDSSWTAEDLSRQAIEESMWLFERAFPRILAGEVFPSFPNVGGKYYEKTHIQDTMIVGSSIANWIRAVTFKEFYPKLNINGTIYKVVKE